MNRDATVIGFMINCYKFLAVIPFKNLIIVSICGKV